MTKFVEIAAPGDGPWPATDGRAWYVGVYTPNTGSIDAECAFFWTEDEARAHYDELLTRPGYTLEP